MGNNRMTVLVSLAVVFAMAVPVYAIATANTNVETALPGEYALVRFDSPNQANTLRDLGTNIVSLNEWGAYVKITESQRDIISENMNIVDLQQRTTIDLMEQGITFDTRIGYDIPAELKKADTHHYLVQFVTPGAADWYDGINAITNGVTRNVNDYVVVADMTPEQKAAVEDLDYVQWVGQYEPAFKLDSKLQDKVGPTYITIDTYPGTDIPNLMARLATMGAEDIIDTQYGSVTCQVDSSQFAEVAAIEDASLVWFLPEMKTLNNVGGRISQAWDLWDNSVSNLPQDIAGQGQIVHVQDTGIDATHRDFLQGPLGDRLENPDSTTDTDGHGTHVSGTVGGNGYNMESYLGLSTVNRVYNELASSNPANRPDRAGFAGRAPECTIYFRAGLTSAEWTNGYAFGARIFTNSWGPASMSNGYDATADNFMNSNSGALVLFAAGNDGPRHNTVSGGGNGKLGISVGAVENMRPIDFDSSDDYGQMASFSSRGPAGTTDYRIKPDICEIGTAVYSVCSDDSTEYLAAPLYDLVSIINQDPDAAVGDYVSLQGTSMACPAAAGDSALIRDYLVDVRGIAAPHPNIIKNLIIHGAVDMGLGYPSYDQGWGRVNVRNSICPPAPNTLQWYHHTGISSGNWDASTQFDLNVIDESVPLKITMSHWDSIGSGTLTTDYDLVAIAPDGTRYEGNAFTEAWSTEMTAAGQWGSCAFPSWVGGGAYDWDTADDGGDDINNVEIIRVEEPRAGTWDVRVYWKSGGAQPFDVAITGGMNPASDINAGDYTYKVSLNLDLPSRIVTERDDFGTGVFKAAPSGSVIVPYWVNNGDATADTYALTAPILPSGFTATFYPASVATTAGERVHGYARINVGSAVTQGTYTVGLRATSTSDGTVTSNVKFQVDVQTVKTPPTWKIADTPAHEDAPAFVSWSSGSNDYIACAYRQDEQYGDKAYFIWSSDGGRTWTQPQAISQDSWTPGYLGITRATNGAYAGRLMIAYNAWNPDGYGGSTSDTRCSYIKVHYADPPYTSWTEVDAFVQGEGPATVSGANSYRTININWYPNGEQFYLTVEDFGYSGTDLGSATQNLIATIGKASSDGGANWGSWTRIDPGVSTMYYFFPNVMTDELGNLALYYYERDSGDAAQDRDATFQYYTGSWGSMRSVWDTPDNLMMPQTCIAPQGVNNNRAYGAYLKGPNTDGDRELYLVWTDDAGTTFNTNGGAGFGPYGPIMSDHDYGTRFVYDMAYSIDGYVWTFGHRNVRYDPFGQPNMLAVYDNDYTGGAATVVDYMTMDSYVHGKQWSAPITEDGGKVFLAQNSFTKEGGQDIIGMHVYNGWKTATDDLGPITEYVSTDYQIMPPGTIVSVVANCHEWQTGGNNIAAAQYYTDQNPTPVAMNTMDGAFNSPAEAVESGTDINTAGWAGGWHKIWVRGQDTLGNWGDWTETQIFIDAPRRPDQPTNPDPYDGEPDVALSKAFSVYVEDYEGNNMNVNFYWLGNPTPFATLNNQASKTTVTTGAIALTGDTTYYWYATATDGTGTTQSDTWTFTTLDTVAPTSPTLNTVDRFGPGSSTTTVTMSMTSTDITVNSLAADHLTTAQSSTDDSYYSGNRGTVYTGFRAWVRTSGGVETELTGGSAESIVSRAVNGAGIQTTTWSCPSTALSVSDSIVVRVYQSLVTPPTNLAAVFTTSQLGATNLDAATWTINYWTSRGASLDYFRWGSATYDSNIENFKWSTVGSPLDHNTLNWTLSGDDGAGANDVMRYNIYRSTVSGGPWDGTTYLTSVGSGINTYIDLNRGAADGTLWWYVVRAEDLANNEDTNTNAVQELGTEPPETPFEIPLSGFSAGEWTFVSFPDTGVSGNIQTILDDSVLGDGATTWDVAKWYNPLDTSDPWKTYRVGASNNDLTTIDNTMGVWLHLTANGGDQVLTVSIDGTYSGSNVIVPLYAGWNLVSYPSATDRLASTTLPGAADLVAYYNGVAAYLITDAAPNTVTFSEGNAYWVHVTSDVPWSVAP